MNDQKTENEPAVDILEISLNNIRVTLGSVVDVVNQLDKDSINNELMHLLAETSDEYNRALRDYITIIQGMSAEVTKAEDEEEDSV